MFYLVTMSVVGGCLLLIGIAAAFFPAFANWYYNQTAGRMDDLLRAMGHERSPEQVKTARGLLRFELAVGLTLAGLICIVLGVAGIP